MLKTIKSSKNDRGKLRNLRIFEDADLVVVMGPTENFMKEELEAIDAYRRNGGSIWLALDPGTKTDFSAVLSPVGLSFEGRHLLAGSINKLLSPISNIDTPQASHRIQNPVAITVSDIMAVSL